MKQLEIAETKDNQGDGTSAILALPPAIVSTGTKEWIRGIFFLLLANSQCDEWAKLCSSVDGLKVRIKEDTLKTKVQLVI